MSKTATRSSVPLARVSESTRETGRIPVQRQIERMRVELKTLLAEKKALEFSIQDVTAWKAHETAEILSSRYPKSRSIELTTRLESDFRTKRKPLTVQLYAMEERIHALKTRLGEKSGSSTQNLMELREKREIESLETLHNIQLILNRIAKKLGV